MAKLIQAYNAMLHTPRCSALGVRWNPRNIPDVQSWA